VPRALLAGVLALLGAAALAPASADALCARPDGTFGYAQAADVIVVATARGDGLKSNPVTFTVDRYDKGSGPRTVAVDTGRIVAPDGSTVLVEDAITPAAGERWRIYGHLAGATMSSTICDGSHPLADGPTVPPRATGARLRPSTWLGLPRAGRTSATASPAAVRALRVSRGVDDLWLLRGHRRIAHGEAKGNTWRLPSSARPRHGDRVVVDTGAAFYAVAVR
jgi:hypothetical protein